MFNEKQKEVEEQDEVGWLGSEGDARMLAQGFGRACEYGPVKKKERERERQRQIENDVYRVHERICTHIRTYMYTCVNVETGSRGGGGRREKGREKEERKGSRIRVCARAGDRERNLKIKKKGQAGKEKETKSSYVVYMYHMYIYICILKVEGDRRGMR